MQQLNQFFHVSADTNHNFSFEVRIEKNWWMLEIEPMPFAQETILLTIAPPTRRI